MTPSGDIETVTFNNAFFDELGRSSGIVAVVNEAAERIADIARSTAPVKSGDYRDSITTADAPRRGRHVTEVIASDPAAVAIEARFGTLARATLKAKLR